MADDDFDLVGRVRIDTSDLGNVSSSITGSFGKMAGIAGAALAGIGLSEWVKGGIDSLNNMDRIQQQTAAVIKSTGGAAGVTAQQIGDYADAVEKSTGIESESIREGENMLLTFTNVKNGVGKGNDIFTQSSNILGDLSTAMGTDAKSSAIQLGKALNDPVKGVTALTKVGVTFSDQQKAQIEQMIKVGDTAGAQKIILAELQKEFGGSAEAFGKSGAGSMAKFENAMGDLQEAIAKGILPIVTKLAGFITENMPKAVAIVSEVFDALAGGFQNPDATHAMGGFEGALLSIGEAAGRVARIVKEVVGIVVKIIKGDLSGAGVDIGKLFGAEKDSKATGNIIKTLETIKNAISTVIDFVLTNGPKVAVFFTENVLPVIKQVGEFISNNLVPIVAGIGAALAASGIISIIGTITTLITTLGPVILALVSPVGLAIAAIALLVAGAVYAYEHFAGFRDLVNTVASTIVDAFTGVIQFAQEIFPQLQEAIGHVFNAIVDIIHVALDIASGFWHLFGDDITKYLGGVFQIIKAIVETAINVIANVIRLVLAIINGDWGKAWDALKGIVFAVFEGIKGIVSGALQAVSGIIGGVYDALKTAASGAFGAITEAITGVVGGMFNIGRSIMDGIIDGIKSLAGKLIDTIKTNVTDALPGFVKDALGIHSGSRVFREIFQHVPEGAALGIADGASAVTSAMAKLTDVPSLNGVGRYSAFGSGASGGVNIEVNFNGPITDGDSVRGAIPQLTDALRAAVGGF